MPSLHFATSAMAALLLSETGPIAGAVGVNYAILLGLALVYTGEHYVVDLLGGLALCVAVRRAEPLARRPLRAAGQLIGGARRLALEPGSR
jgi:membrane-associated phospholipid phosphatase